MTIIRVLTAVAVSALLSTSAMAMPKGGNSNSAKIGSAGTADGAAILQGKGVAGFSVQNVDSKTSLGNGTTSTDASSVSAGGAKFGTVIVGGSASAASGGSTGH